MKGYYMNNQCLRSFCGFYKTEDKAIDVKLSYYKMASRQKQKRICWQDGIKNLKNFAPSK